LKRLLLDQGVPRSAVSILNAEGWDVVHVGDIGMSKAHDRAILEFAERERRVCVTLDADFHAIGALVTITEACSHSGAIMQERLNTWRPPSMLFDYVQKAIERAKYKQLEDRSWYAEIPGFRGVWAQGKSVEACRKELWSVLEEWLILKLRDNEPIPRVSGVSLKIKEAKVA
jgi:predicted RNase H-like HicB family nuclease